MFLKTLEKHKITISIEYFDIFLMISQIFLLQL